MGLSKALVEVLDRAAVDPSRGLPRTFEVQFNPNAYSISKDAVYGETPIPGLTAPLLSFMRGEAERLSMELFFDTTLSAKDVRDETRAFFELVKIQPRTHAPPRMRFTWGKGLTFQGVVESVSQHFMQFDSSGLPLRARLSVAFRQYLSGEQQLKELNLQSADHTKVHEVRRGDTLISIAAEQYDDPHVWRAIAEANPTKVDNPRKLIPGTVLILPRLESLGQDR